MYLSLLPMVRTQIKYCFTMMTFNSVMLSLLAILANTIFFSPFLQIRPCVVLRLANRFEIISRSIRIWIKNKRMENKRNKTNKEGRQKTGENERSYKQKKMKKYEETCWRTTKKKWILLVKWKSEIRIKNEE